MERYSTGHGVTSVSCGIGLASLLDCFDVQRPCWSAPDRVDRDTARRIDTLRRASNAMTRIDTLRGVEFGLRGALLELQRGTQDDAAIALSRLVLCTVMLGGDTAAVTRSLARAERLAIDSSNLGVRTHFYYLRGIARYVGPLGFDSEAALADFDRCSEGFAQRAIFAPSYNRDLCEWLRAMARVDGGELAATASELRDAA